MLNSKGLRRFNRLMDLRLQFLVCALAGWLNRQQQAVIDYQREEISVLLEQNGGKLVWVASCKSGCPWHMKKTVAV